MQIASPWARPWLSISSDKKPFLGFWLSSPALVSSATTRIIFHFKKKREAFKGKTSLETLARHNYSAGGWRSGWRSAAGHFCGRDVFGLLGVDEGNRRKKKKKPAGEREREDTTRCFLCFRSTPRLFHNRVTRYGLLQRLIRVSSARGGSCCKGQLSGTTKTWGESAKKVNSFLQLSWKQWHKLVICKRSCTTPLTSVTTELFS